MEAHQEYGGVPLRQSKSEIYSHLVWTTGGREPFLTAEIERPVYRCIENEARRLECEVLAIGGMSDHVPLCVKVPTPLAVARLMNQVKGVSSHFVHDQLPDSLPFRWQEDYGVFSIGPNQVSRVLSYIENQKAHHAENSLQIRWEETDEEYQPRP